jgi:hypothetical protein
VNTILVGVDGSEHAKDAIAFASKLGQVTKGPVVVACGFCGDGRREAEATARRMSLLLAGVDPARVRIRTVATCAADHGLREIAKREDAAIVIVGSSRAGGPAQTLPSCLGAQLLDDAAFAVGVAPHGYRARLDHPIGRVGVTYDGYAESRSALIAAVAAVHAFGADLEVFTVRSSEPDMLDLLLAGGVDHQVLGDFGCPLIAVPTGAQAPQALLVGSA